MLVTYGDSQMRHKDRQKSPVFCCKKSGNPNAKRHFTLIPHSSLHNEVILLYNVAPIAWTLDLNIESMATEQSHKMYRY